MGHFVQIRRAGAVYGCDVASRPSAEGPAAGRHPLRHGVPRGLAEATGQRRTLQGAAAVRQGQRRSHNRRWGHRVSTATVPQTLHVRTGTVSTIIVPLPYHTPLLLAKNKEVLIIGGGDTGWVLQPYRHSTVNGQCSYRYRSETIPWYRYRTTRRCCPPRTKTCSSSAVETVTATVP